MMEKIWTDMHEAAKTVLSERRISDYVTCGEVAAAILSKYHAEFDDEDGVMHDVYFALAKAEWMCCAQSELVLNRVKEIIESGANIEFYRELEATESDLKLRKKNLEKFLKKVIALSLLPSSKFIIKRKTT